jgi:peptide/nickel transport system ATP-binding protein
LLNVEDLTIALPRGGDRLEALSAVSLPVHANEIVCVVGESGAGKSMMATAVVGLLPPRVTVTGGRILFEGTDLLTLSPKVMREIRGRRIGLVFQDPMTALNPLLKVGRQIEEVMLVHGFGTRLLRRRRALELLTGVGLPDPELIYNSYPFRLSGGQRQRVVIAIALALRPSLLIADEPTSSLDVTTQMTILQLIRTVQTEQSMGVLFITHDFGVVAEIADRVVVMHQGRVVESGNVGVVLKRPQHPYTKTLLTAIGRFDAALTRPSVQSAGIVLEVAGLVRLFRRGGGLLSRPRRIVALDGVAFTLKEGETLGLVGESGSGKSTLARCIVRLLDPSGGSIRFQGTELLSLSGSRLRPFRRTIQMIFQDPYGSLNPRQKVVDIIADAPATHGLSRREARQCARELLRLVGLNENAAERYPHEFSGGQRQRIGIARALALRPVLLVCDEPVSALDVSVQAQILSLLANIRQDFGLTTLFITHDLRAAAQVCDRIAVMQEGRIVEQGPVSIIFQRPQHAYTQALVAAIPGQAFFSNSNRSPLQHPDALSSV